MQIEIVGRDTNVDDAIRQQVAKRFGRLGKQVSEGARLEIVLREEANPSIKDKFVAEATLWEKKVTLHAEERAPLMRHSIKALSLDISRQVKRHGELSRKRSTTRRLVGRMRGREA